MANTTISTSNMGKPAPRWYRLTKKIIYLLTSGTVLFGIGARFGVSAEDMNLIVSVLIFIGEGLSSLLANGEVYAPADPVTPETPAP